MKQRMCKVCLKIKPWIAHKQLRIDKRGKRWHGLKCPDCFREEAAQRNTLYRNVGSSKAVPVPGQRLCRKCDGVLGPDKYFFHESCAPAAFTEVFDDWSGRVHGFKGF